MFRTETDRSFGDRLKNAIGDELPKSYPVKDVFILSEKSEDTIKEFIVNLKYVSDITFGIDILKLKIVDNKVFITASGTDSDLKLWLLNTHRIFEFFDEYGD